MASSLGSLAVPGSDPAPSLPASKDNALSWVLQSLLPPASAGLGERVLIGNGLPCIPKKLLDKIQNWEFVDLSELLPSTNATEASATGSPTARFSLFPGYEVVRHRRRQISNITDWCQAFAVYMAALVSQHPSATLDLIAYMLTIVKASQQYDGLYWRAYDTNYRLTAAASGNRCWSRLDTDLFTRFFTGRARLISACTVCDSVAHRTEECPEVPSGSSGTNHVVGPKTTETFAMKRQKTVRTWAPYLCADYNAKGKCGFGSGCKYRHNCGRCGGSHPAKSCPTSRKS